MLRRTRAAVLTTLDIGHRTLDQKKPLSPFSHKNSDLPRSVFRIPGSRVGSEWAAASIPNLSPARGDAPLATRRKPVDVSLVWVTEAPEWGRHSVDRRSAAPIRGLNPEEGVRIPPAHAGGKQSVTPVGVCARIPGKPQQVGLGHRRQFRMVVGTPLSYRRTVISSSRQNRSFALPCSSGEPAITYRR
jgi:hypothetical protein